MLFGAYKLLFSSGTSTSFLYHLISVWVVTLGCRPFAIGWFFISGVIVRVYLYLLCSCVRLLCAIVY